jgi:hypothetical protein
MSDLKLADFARHVEEVNIDFKENIMKKVDVIKLKDTADLQQRVDELKHDEFLAAEKLNKQYMILEQKEQHLIDKTKNKKHLLMGVVGQWEQIRKTRLVFGAWKKR